MNDHIKLMHSIFFELENDIEQGHINSSSFNKNESSLNVKSFNGLVNEQENNNEIQKKTCCDLLFCGKYTLTKQERNTFNILKVELLVLYDENDKEHEKLLKNYYDIMINTFEKNEVKWKDFGFQSENPRTDFRASGLYALKFLIYFSNKYPKVIFSFKKGS